jgi:hypothetical protein
MRAFGGWADRTDLDELVAEIYADRQGEDIVPSGSETEKEEQREETALCEEIAAEIEADLVAEA